ncbi:hypothetical protein GGR57DRAFT_459359 [Xylariaceae sp. FL1272]|nr:hypothetical protein GGR57DRAFT_459359 [Xylariaceae sp. FL1272]
MSKKLPSLFRSPLIIDGSVALFLLDAAQCGHKAPYGQTSMDGRFQVVLPLRRSSASPSPPVQSLVVAHPTITGEHYRERRQISDVELDIQWQSFIVIIIINSPCCTEMSY